MYSGKRGSLDSAGLSREENVADVVIDARVDVADVVVVDVVSIGVAVVVGSTQTELSPGAQIA
jgi:CxxC motif-containing protein